VVKVNTASFYTDANPWPMSWPKSSQVVSGDPGVFQLLGGGAGQAPTDLFLTIRVVGCES
jgi:hypothetical protein